MLRSCLVCVGLALLAALVFAPAGSQTVVSDVDCENLIGGSCKQITVSDHCDNSEWCEQTQKQEACPGQPMYVKTAAAGNVSSVDQEWCLNPCNRECGIYSDTWKDCDGDIYPFPQIVQ